MANYTYKFVRKPYNDSVEKWQEALSKEGRTGWRVIQIFTAPNGHLTALMEKNERLL